VLMFWYLDALFKSFQYRFIERNKQLESFISHGSNDFIPGLVAGNFGRGGTFLQKLRKIVGFAFFDNIFTIYATKVIVLTVIYIFENIA
jgi:hypothetical protein